MSFSPRSTGLTSLSFIQRCPLIAGLTIVFLYVPVIMHVMKIFDRISHRITLLKHNYRKYGCIVYHIDIGSHLHQSTLCWGCSSFTIIMLILTKNSSMNNYCFFFMFCYKLTDKVLIPRILSGRITSIHQTQITINSWCDVKIYFAPVLI